jgi:transcription elongation factor GreA
MIKYPMTRSGREEFERELQEMQGPKMREILQMLSEAREKGDLSENAEYDAAKNLHEQHQMKINNLQSILTNSVIIDESKIQTDKVQILTKVNVLNTKTNKEHLFNIVPENEINISEGKISHNSPIGKGLIGKSVGDSTIIEVPAGKIEYKILNISI